MIEPRIIIKANNDRTSITIRVTAINSPDWVDIVGTRIELSRDSSFSNIFYTNSTTHYKVRAYLDDEAPNQTIYGRVTLTKEDNTTLVKTFNFITPYPVLGTVKDEENTQYITSMRKMDKNGNLSPRNYTNKAVSDAPAYIDIVADEAGEMVVANQWARPVLVQNITQNLAQVEVARDTSTTVAVDNGDIVRVTEQTANYSFRRFSDNSNPLCKGVSAHITVMPPMERFASYKDGRIMGDYFFYAFNYNGTLTSLPEGSFDIHRLAYARRDATYTYGVFAHFNHSGALTSLPEGSFDTSNFMDSSYADYYYTDEYGNSVRAQHIQLSHWSFQGFNQLGALTSLPDGSFDFDNLKSVDGASILEDFNNNGALTSLPEGSFGFSSFVEANNLISGITFKNFNTRGRLVSLPDGAFHFHKNSILNNDGFNSFNSEGSLTSLPAHSFNFLIKRGNFSHFNYKGGITSLPAGSFRFVTDEEAVMSWSSCFQNFNREGALTSLPEGSFNLERVITLPGGAFRGFNHTGALTSLPEGSFNFENVTAANINSVCAEFNKNGALKSLPKGSFNFKSLTNINCYSFCAEFNRNGAIEYLPIGSFSVNNVTSVYQSISADWQPFYYFNYGGKLTKSDTDYNPNHIYPTQSQITTITAYYYEPSTQTQFSETVSGGNPFKYYQADYFNVSYTPSQAYTTNLADEYLSGQTITFSATAIDPEYMAVPTITTAGGTTVTVTNNGNDTYTFVMPQDDITVTFAVSLRPASITLVAEETGTMVLTNQWTTPVTVKNVTQDTTTTVTGSSSANISVNTDDEITVTEGTAGTTFRNWRTLTNPNLPRLGLATGVFSRITNMPDMDRFTTNSNGNVAGQYFFCCFCAGDNNFKGITSLPAGSFDTSDITGKSGQFFAYFNQKGALTSLPAGSFQIGQITTTQSADNFFRGFNQDGALTSLPNGSFDTSNITYAAAQFFNGFNMRGKLTSLPAGSFDTSSITFVRASYFASFNSGGELTSLPAGSFKTNGLTQLYWDCFNSFNYGGKLTSLPAGSFNLSNITGVTGSNIFQYFNDNGELTSLPDGSFDISGITSTSSNSNFFSYFNSGGKLASLPAGSFNISNITTVGGSFFAGFNSNGRLTSLPTGSFILNPAVTTVSYSFFSNFNTSGDLTSLPDNSFNIINITTVGNDFFAGFNSSGKLTSLPVGSFNTSNITTVGSNFFSSFNRSGRLTSLPANSFDTSGITSAPNGFCGVFNYGGSLTSLPAGSFDTSNITTFGNGAFEGFAGGGSRIQQLPAGSFRFDSLTSVGNSFCINFNFQGLLASLPAGSFNIDNLVTAGGSLFESFNYQGGSNFASLPVGSFNTSSLTTVGARAFYWFNYTGGLTTLPTNSFSTNSLTTVGNNFFYQFNQFGKIEKDTTAYNPDCVNKLTSDISAYYYKPDTQTSYSENVAAGNPFYYKTA